MAARRLLRRVGGRITGKAAPASNRDASFHALPRPRESPDSLESRLANTEKWETRNGAYRRCASASDSAPPRQPRLHDRARQEMLIRQVHFARDTSGVPLPLRRTLPQRNGALSSVRAVQTSTHF